MPRTPDGQISRTPDGGAVISFEWYYDRPVASVWAALTRPEQIALWLGDAEVDLTPGGVYRILWRGDGAGTMEGRILEVDPPRLLVHTWHERDHGESTLKWVLTAEGEGSLLQLTHTFPAGQDAVPFLAGWHDFLYSLLAAADGYRSAYDPDRERQIDVHYRVVRSQ